MTSKHKKPSPSKTKNICTHLLETVQQVATLLLLSNTSDELSTSLAKATTLIREHVSIDSIHILENHGTNIYPYVMYQYPYLEYKYGWNHKSNMPSIHIPIGTHFPYEAKSSDDKCPFQTSKNYIDYEHFKTRFPDLCLTLNKEQKDSIIGIPVCNGSSVSSLVAYTSKDKELTLSEHEITFLNSISTIVIGTVSRISQGLQLSESNTLLRVVKNVASTIFDEMEKENMEGAVYECLRLIGEATQTDRVQNWKNEIIDGKLHFVLYEEWTSDLGGTKLPVPKQFSYPYEKIPIWEEMFRRGESINGPLSKLSEEEKNLLAPFGMVSIVLTPLFLNGELWGFFSVDDCRNERYFTDEEMSILNSVGFMLVSALEQFRMVKSIQHRDALYDTVNQVANLLQYTEDMNFEKSLYQSLDLMGKSLQVEKVNLWKHSKDEDKILCLASYDAPGNSSVIYIGYEGSHYCKEILKKNQIINVLIESLPEKEYLYFKNLDVKSFLFIPIFLKEEFWGGLAFANCLEGKIFPENEVVILRSAGHMIANALQRNEFLKSIKETSIQLEAALAEARNANNIKTNFLANMSHEMRTPLNAIIGLSELSLESGELSPKDEQNLEKIYTSGNHLLRLVNDILDISKIEAGKLELNIERYDLASLLNEIINVNVIRIGEKPIDFVLHIAEDLPLYLLGDDLRVKQIISNLLSNAFKYTERGVVELSIEGKYDKKEEDYIWLSISVKDNGIGIKEEELGKLFHDYTRLSPSSNRKKEGTGLGLSITKKLTKMMGGDVSVISTYGLGSIFTVHIRQQVCGEDVLGKQVVENLQNFRYTDAKRRNATALLRSKMPYAKVLVVDDNPTNLYVFQNILKPYDMYVDCVTSGPEAIEAIRKEKVIYDAIFMDHMMPEMDGLEATRIIREEIGTHYARNIPIIACTANAIVGSKKMFLSNGFQGFLSKPVDIFALDHLLRQWVYKQEFHEGIKEDAPSPDISMEENNFDLDHNIPGLSTEASLELFDGNVEDYIKFINFFATNTRKKLETIQEISPDNLKDYAITVHGIKGSCFWIGANEIGNEAEKLEKAALKGQLEYVLANHPSFIKNINALIDNILTFSDKRKQ